MVVFHYRYHCEISILHLNATEKTMQSLKDNGYGSLVVETVNANTLSSFVKEQKAENNDEVPSWLSDVISVFEKVSVGVRKG